MPILTQLTAELLNQPFDDKSSGEKQLAECQKIAQTYALLENSIAVLSDLKANKSYIYRGRLAENIGVGAKEVAHVIDSIWEEELFDKIHPDDLVKKHRLELHFFQLLKSLPIHERSDFHITSRMRMLDKAGRYIPVHHRMFYIGSCQRGNLWLALCLYNHAYQENAPEAGEGVIVNSAQGQIISWNEQKWKNLLSRREKEILLLIERGKISKEIAEILSVSKNTISRHRQNILAKLRVKNSLEACRMAKQMGVI